MPKRPEDPRSFSERVYPIVTLLEKLGHPVKMPDHLLADDDRYKDWMTAVVDQLEADLATAGGEVAPANLADRFHRLQCVVGANVQRLASMLDYDIEDTDDIGQELDRITDHFIDLVERIVERNEELANQLEDCNTGMAAVRSLDKPHDPDNPAHQPLIDPTERVPVTGKVSGRQAAEEDAPPLRENRPDEDQPPAPVQSPAKQPSRGSMAGPWR